MDGFLTFLVIAAVFAAILGGMAWIAVRARRRGLGDSITGPWDEIWHPTAHQAHIEIREQEERATPRPSPDDK